VIKRTLDIILAFVAIVLSLPIFCIIAILVVIKLGRPILFSQLRPGLHGEIFRLYKFRSMSSVQYESGELKEDSARLTKFGHMLRSLSLDELPSLWNVLKGDMSLVGPRPLLVEYLPLYSEEQFLRHNVRPGITGWAQVNGRNAISWEEKFKLDNYYVDHQCFWFDFKVLLLTAKKVFIREGITEEGQVTMSKFTGNNVSGVHSE